MITMLACESIAFCSGEVIREGGDWRGWEGEGCKSEFPMENMYDAHMSVYCV